MHEFETKLPDGKKDESQKQLDALLVESIDQAIGELMGPSVLESFYAILAKSHQVTRDELPNHLDNVSSVLESVFRLKGSDTIHRTITRRFCRKLELPFEESHLPSLDDYVNLAKHRFEERTRSPVQDVERTQVHKRNPGLATRAIFKDRDGEEFRLIIRPSTSEVYNPDVEVLANQGWI